MATNRHSKQGRFSSSGFISTHKNDFVGGTNYTPKNKVSWLTWFMIILAVGLISLFVLYNNVPEIRYAVDLFI